ncbi:MAG: ammonia-forming cytochrome c nitrite reductase subunit c552 [Ignavibacteriaceae bacterium]
MKTKNYLIIFLAMLSVLLLQDYIFAQTCQSCHTTEAGLWSSSKHASSQADVASEISANWVGQTPDSVIIGSQAEDCISCHAPTADTVNGGMSEIQAMGYFFSTTNGKYTSTTQPTNTSSWPNVDCNTCHQSDMTTFGVFNSVTKTYDAVKTANDLCGNCHGTLRHPDTDHRIYDAWLSSKHGHKGQDDVAGELAGSHSGQTPAQVIAGEDCIACHAPTSVTLNGGMTESQALGKFFSTSNGTFTSNTSPSDTVDYTNVSCIACHNPHDPDTLSYFNSATKSYQIMSSSDSLCGQCHGNLRFPNTDHLSYNISSGTGGVKVANVISMSGIKCIDCHMYNTGVDGSNSAMFKGHTWSVFVKEPDGSVDASCTKCHSTMSADSSMALVQQWKNNFQSLDSVAELKVTNAANYLKNSQDSANFNEAQFNMTYAESDESGGIHNHLYSVALLNDAISKANLIVTGISVKNVNEPITFNLSQNYPNPFNPSTKINFSIPRQGYVTLKVYDMLGKEIATLVNRNMNEGNYSADFSDNIITKQLSSGIYIYQLKEEEFVQTRKMVLLK